MKKILSLILFLVFFLVSSNFAFADENFATKYNVTYDVSDKGTTRVLLDIELRNKTTEFYASSYTVQTGFRKIENLSVSDREGILKVQAKENNKGVEVSFSFNKNVVGINNSQKFRISFDTHEVAKSNGSIWEVNIPGIANQEEFEDFNVVIDVPDSFGNPVVVKPHVQNLNLSGSSNTLRFAKNELNKSGVSIAYGDSQIYSFTLDYHLFNNKVFPINTQIAIPSNNNYQEITIGDIIPAPLDVEIDRDGNWLAKYKLLPSQVINIRVRGSAKVSYLPKKEELSPENRKLYLRQQPYWESNDPVIKKVAGELKTPEAIYKYVVNNLKYDTSRIKDVQERAGAKGVILNKKSAVCLEFTDLFVALSRAAGIPARSVEGYANTNNSANRPLSLFKDVLHAWPQYYDSEKEAWIMVDPTWENTTQGLDYFNVFDFDHLAFIIKGVDSEYPTPAGGYKIPGKESTKDVEVRAFKTIRTNEPILSTGVDFEEKYIGGLPIEGNIEIHNYSGIFVPKGRLEVLSDTLSPKKQNLEFENLPPYGKTIVLVKFDPRPILTNEADIIRISIGNETLEEKIVILPFYRNIYFILGGIIIGSITIIIFAVIRRSRRLHVS